ncbi:uncharacterized protein ACLA_091220 [Aspergillus clavatus NRRL 1]|uniref:ATPase inhibitor, mitochondrial n=1 Tax=Aspergillus clavatus (strain ATCC 1007 / CBS 513.65 / DSM 816 / NCTC 3887 / NRRL 1 / QM 1276 / 107) TaxID=344612 RepID=A1CEX5_ASPCL|nr:mitochondrial ATPase inhibitor, putative [Aspergillus clavatus NRRL 1]EAW11424.1 mitochondrial ATPase inhibitor, putative [Aspergillus clavatus NRRL 1]
MFRQSVTRPLASANSAIVNRSFSALAPRMGAGDTGAPRAGGSQSGDSFTRREAAQESLYIHEKEKEKLESLRKKIKEQQAHLAELDKHLDDFTKNQGKN